MDECVAHWESTLMGFDFWRKQDEKSQSQLHDGFIPGDPNAHMRLPFTLSSEQCSHAPSSHAPSIETSRKRRRFSMSDVLGIGAFTSNGNSNSNSNSNINSSGSIAGSYRSSSRFFDFAKRGRSRSPSKLLSRPRGRSLMRTPFNMSSSRRKRRESIDSVLSTPPPNGQGTPDKPLVYFRGGASWRYLNTDMESLGLDLFWPIKEDPGRANEKNNSDMLNIEELRPLCEFRNLRVLKITGMMQSYQKYIWQAAWLNMNLEELELGMMLEPCLRKNFAGDWPCIKGGWRLRDIQYGEPVYHGNNGTGNLNRKIGIGEYLDKLSIEQAKLGAMMQGPTSSRLSIRSLTLTGFVVDADPFLLWFNPGRLRHINFKDNCVDAGFYLPASMQGKVTLVYPRRVQERAIAIPVRRVEVKRELKVVELRGGRKVEEKPYRVKQKRDGTPRWKGRQSSVKKDEGGFWGKRKKAEESVNNRDGFKFKHGLLNENRNVKDVESGDGDLAGSCNNHCLSDNSSIGSVNYGSDIEAKHNDDDVSVNDNYHDCHYHYPFQKKASKSNSSGNLEKNLTRRNDGSNEKTDTYSKGHVMKETANLSKEEIGNQKNNRLDSLGRTDTETGHGHVHAHAHGHRRTNTIISYSPTTASPHTPIAAASTIVTMASTSRRRRGPRRTMMPWLGEKSTK